MPEVHVLFVHRNFPAQFGYLAAELVRRKGWRCTFVSETEPGEAAGIEKIQYQAGVDRGDHAHPLVRGFEDDVRHAAAVYDRLKPLRSHLMPDLVVGHSGLGSTLFLPDLFPDAPLISYFEDFYQPSRSAMEFRADWPPSEEDRLRARVLNATVLMDLEYCRAGYAPTRFQHGLLPAEYAGKVRVIHDGIDTRFWRRPEEMVPRSEFSSPRIVTYVSRGLEALRGFDIFMKVAKRVYEAYPDVLFLVIGGEEAAYGNELRHVAEKSFKEHVLTQDHYDLERIRFLGTLAPEVLVQILSMSDLHVYLTAPFALSWSLLDAMACGCVVLASDTAPVREVITTGKNGILLNFFDIDGLAATAVSVLEDPPRYRELGRAAERVVSERYGLDVVLPRMVSFYEEVVAGGAEWGRTFL